MTYASLCWIRSQVLEVTLDLTNVGQRADNGSCLGASLELVDLLDTFCGTLNTTIRFAFSTVPILFRFRSDDTAPEQGSVFVVNYRIGASSSLINCTAFYWLCQ